VESSQPKGVKDKRTQIKKLCKLVRVLKQKCVKTNGRKTRAGHICSKKHVFNVVHAPNFSTNSRVKILATFQTVSGKKTEL
jgi:hypothetical protein